MEFRLTEDLYLAKEEFQTKKLALVFVKHTEVLYTDVQSSLLPLIKAIEQLKERAKGATGVDKVIGRAAAMLLIQAQVEQVY